MIPSATLGFVSPTFFGVLGAGSGLCGVTPSATLGFVSSSFFGVFGAGSGLCGVIPIFAA